jgi:hypothetical protein
MKGGVIDAQAGTTGLGVEIKGPATTSGTTVEWSKYGTFTMSGGTIKGCTTAGVKIEINGVFTKSGTSTIYGNQHDSALTNAVSIHDCINFALAYFDSSKTSGTAAKIAGANSPDEPKVESASIGGLAMPDFTSGAKWSSDFGPANKFERPKISGNYYEVAAKIAASSVTITSPATSTPKITLTGGTYSEADTKTYPTNGSLRFVTPANAGATPTFTSVTWTVSNSTSNNMITAAAGTWNMANVPVYVIVPAAMLGSQPSGATGP